MAYISTEEVRAIRNGLKAKFPNLKFSVTKDNHTSVNVSIMAGNVNFDEVFRDEPRRHFQVNHYHLGNYGEHAQLFEQILEIIHTAPGTVEGGREWFDKSDAMTDYFHTAFYIHINVGKWNKGYEQRN